ncbi:hypothetical protein GWI33_009300 [Rhynchophorus ferrugineus]|uniref:Uncharacterized protein n=1 Tax=Rhynchophorus ferrugineus TaxID=354439 RepID=A0A834IBP6_RHYFE|nr:hypothetical protein GWI33_009300 [Rhynchophorus ferrugineus]
MLQITRVRERGESRNNNNEKGKQKGRWTRLDQEKQLKLLKLRSRHVLSPRLAARNGPNGMAEEGTALILTIF